VGDSGPRESRNARRRMTPMHARWMIPLLTALVAVVAQAQEAPEPGFTVSAEWTVHWGKRRSVVIGPDGHLVNTVSHPLLMLEERGDLIAERDLLPCELSALEALVRESGIMGFPEDLSSPPYYVDEAIAVLEIHLEGKLRHIIASVIDWAIDQEARCFAWIWQSVMALSDEPRDPHGVVPVGGLPRAPSSERSPRCGGSC